MIASSAATKIVQPSRSRLLLHRPRLVRFLHEHMDRRLIVISAAAGSGKTALLIDFVHETALPTCWYSLEASDGDPLVFLDYLIASIQSRFPKVGERTRRALAGGVQDQTFDAVIGSLVSEMRERVPEPCVLVFDDFHTIAPAESVHHLINLLLDLLPSHVHVIIASRTLPPQFDFSQLQATQQMVALGDDELKFTGAELRALAKQNYHMELAPEQADNIALRSEGWIAGILLTTPDLWPGIFQRRMRDQGAQENLFRFLANEAFGHLSPQLQRFLIESAIFNRLEAPVCDQVLGIQDSAQRLRAIEEQNLFIVRLAEGTDQLVYRYHVLYQEFLNHRLKETDPARWHLLHQRAAAYYATQENLRGQAIAHHLAAEQFDEATHWIEQIGQATFDAGRWTVLAGWIDALPSTVLEAHPKLIVLRGLVFAETGKNADADVSYTLAIDLYERKNDAVAAAKVMVWRAMLWNVSGRYRDAVKLCETALAALQGQPAPAEEARIYRILGTAHAHLGEYPRCLRELEHALERYQQMRDLTRVAWLHHDLGTCLRMHGERIAELHFQQALQIWQRTENTVGMALTLNSIGVGYHLAGDYTRALDTLLQARQLAHQTGNQRSEAGTLASLGDVYRDLGQGVEAQLAYRTSVELSRRTDGFILTYALIGLAETLLHLEDETNVETYLQQASAIAEAHQSNYEMGLAELARGIWASSRGESAPAVRHLNRAVELLKPMKRDGARAMLHLAQVYFAQRKFGPVQQTLQSLVSQAAEVEPNTIPCLVSNRKQLRAVVKYAVSKKIQPDYFQRLLNTMDSLDERAKLSAPIRIHAQAMGSVQVIIDGKELTLSDWSTQVTKELFFLLLNHPKGLRKEQILEALWLDKPLDSASVVFHTTCYRLRRLIPNGILHANEMYSLRPGLQITYDVTQFREWLRRAAEAKGISDRIEAYEAAIALYRGEYFEEVYDDWCNDLREKLHTEYLDALQTLAQIYERHGNWEQALKYYQTLVNHNPDREDIYRTMMRLHVKAGDRAGAVRTYYRCAQVMRDELNLDHPSEETQALYRQIAKGTPQISVQA